MWGQVLNMNDSINVEYGKLEELFSRQDTTAAPKTLAPPEDNALSRKNSLPNTEVSKLTLTLFNTTVERGLDQYQQRIMGFDIFLSVQTLPKIQH